MGHRRGVRVKDLRAEIAVFYTRPPVRPDTAAYRNLEARLSPDYERRLARIHDPTARAMTLVALELLESVARESTFGLPPLRLLAYPSGGRPRWPAGPAFSLSHTEGLVACALARSAAVRVGLDIERIRPIDPSALRHVPAAYPRNADSPSPAALLRRWTRCEAVLKAAGASLCRVREVRLDDDGRLASFAGRFWHLRSVALPRGHVGSVACDVEGFDVAVAVAPRSALPDNPPPVRDRLQHP